MYTPLNQYHVVMEVAPQYWQSPDILKQIYVSRTDYAVHQPGQQPQCHNRNYGARRRGRSERLCGPECFEWIDATGSVYRNYSVNPVRRGILAR